KELSRLTCRRDAGATILSHDQRLCGEVFGCGLAALSNLRALRGREKKCIAGFQPAKVVLTQKELSRLRCRRDAGATIFSHDQRLCGEVFGCGLAALSNLRALRGREKKCIAGFQPAKVVLTQKELSRLRCRRYAGATIFSHDP